MIGLVTIVIGLAMIAAGLGMFPDLEEIPTILGVIFVLFGAILVWAGIYNIWLGIQRRRAYAGGRERKGTARLFHTPTGDDGSVYVLFATSYAEWMVSVSTSGIEHLLDDLGGEGVPAKAYMGTNDKLYGLDIAGVRTKAISAGDPFEGKFRERIERAQALAEKHNRLAAERRS